MGGTRAPKKQGAWGYFRFLSYGLAKNKWCLFNTTHDSGGIATPELVVLQEVAYEKGAETDQLEAAILILEVVKENKALALRRAEDI